MNTLTEKEAEDFLEKEGFNVISRRFAKNKKDLEKIDIKFPWVMKISSKKIVHKAKISGVILNINSLEEAKGAFDTLSKIQGFQEALIQKMIIGEELIIGLKNTEEFGKAIMFGKGGGKVESEKDIAFRILPITKKEAINIISDIKFYRILKEKNANIKLIANTLMKISEFSQKYPNITEMDINPLIVTSQEAIIVDARLILE
jgi:acyl-CoA synthetase (NDP forming)